MVTEQSWENDPYDRQDGVTYLVYTVSEDKDGNIGTRFIVATWCNKIRDWRFADDDKSQCQPDVRFEGKIIKAIAWLRLPTLPIETMNVACALRERIDKIHAQPERNDNAEDHNDSSEEAIDFDDFGDN